MIQGVKFYLEPGGQNAVAVKVDEFHFEYVEDVDGEQRLVRVYDGYGAIFERANSPVEETQVDVRDYRRIPERVARQVHPALFDVL